MEQSIRNEGHIREILDHVCSRGELLILTTPYMRFESTFLRLEENLFHAHASMELEDAKYGLRSPDLKIRFPYGQYFYEGATRLLGLGRAKGRTSLQLALPPSLEDGDYRGAYRAERVGRVPVTFSTRKYELLAGTLVNISTSGVRLFLSRNYEEDELLVDDLTHVAFSLSDDIRINTKVKVRYIREKVFGGEFRPPLEGPLLDSLARWIFNKREEELLAHSRLSAASEQGKPEPRAALRNAELILISSSAALGEQLGALLPAELPRLKRFAPNIQSVKELGIGQQAMVLLHVDSASWETRKRIKALAEALPPALPFVLIGTDLDSGVLFKMSAELKAAWAYPLPPNPGSIFPRLLQGIFRKHFPG